MRVDMHKLCSLCRALLQGMMVAIRSSVLRKRLRIARIASPKNNHLRQNPGKKTWTWQSHCAHIWYWLHVKAWTTWKWFCRTRIALPQTALDKALKLYFVYYMNWLQQVFLDYLQQCVVSSIKHRTHPGISTNSVFHSELHETRLSNVMLLLNTRVSLRRKSKTFFLAFFRKNNITEGMIINNVKKMPCCIFCGKAPND